MRFKLKLKGKRGKTKPGVWPGSRVPVQSKYAVEKARVENVYKYVSINTVEEGSYVVNPHGTYCVTPTGVRASDGKVEVEGVFADGAVIANHFIPDFSPFRVDKVLVKSIQTEHEKNRRSYSEWYATKGGGKRASKSVKTDEAPESAFKKLRIKKAKKVLKLRRVA